MLPPFFFSFETRFLTKPGTHWEARLVSKPQTSVCTLHLPQSTFDYRACYTTQSLQKNSAEDSNSLSNWAISSAFNRLIHQIFWITSMPMTQMMLPWKMDKMKFLPEWSTRSEKGCSEDWDSGEWCFFYPEWEGWEENPGGNWSSASSCQGGQ